MGETTIANDKPVAVLHGVHDSLQVLHSSGDGFVHDPSVHVGIVLQRTLDGKAIEQPFAKLLVLLEGLLDKKLSFLIGGYTHAE